jgi:isopenicillin-N epimerase
MFNPGLIILNHASFGAPTASMLDLSHKVRHSLEVDSPNLRRAHISVLDDLRDYANRLARVISATPGSLALTSNSTLGSAAVARSLPLKQGEKVVMLRSEYPSMIRQWEERCHETGAQLVLLDLPLPVYSSHDIIEVFESVPEASVIVVSLISSSTAIMMPVREIGRWAKIQGACMVVDAAHAVGHVPFDVESLGAVAVFGSLHKWLPLPRALGFLWLDDEYIDVVRPVEISLDWDSPDLLERFSWPGTWDPTNALCLPDALDSFDRWVLDRKFIQAEAVMGLISQRLPHMGVSPTCAGDLLPPRLRSFILPDGSYHKVRVALESFSVRAWLSPATDSCPHPLLRASTHVYNDDTDAKTLITALASSF